MRNVRIYITPLVLVPVTVAGLCVLTAVLVYGAVQHALVVKQDPFWIAAFWTLLASTLGAVVGGVLIWVFLVPMRRFSDAIEELQAQGGVPQAESLPARADLVSRDDLARFKRVTQRVTELLSHVEVKELFPEIVEASSSMRRVLSLVERIAPSNSSVLIAGESGTGKELIAQSIHERSLRAAAPFVAVNCAGIPEGLLESELFGHEKGAFTGAVARRIGRFERADGGSIFLDEIGDMPMGIQAKLLRVLQEHEVERVGGSEPIPVDVRVIAATNRDLAAMVEAGTFREDLFFRINACLLHVPPLRERDGDIPLLVDHFLKQQGMGVTVSPEALAMLSAYRWPGNVRELQNVVETAAVLAHDSIEPNHLPAEISDQAIRHVAAASAKASDDGLDDVLADLETRLITDALREAGGVQKRAAEKLGIKERSLWHRVAKYGIDVSAFKGDAT